MVYFLKDGVVVSEELWFLSDDKSHDTFLTQRMLDEAIRHRKSKNPLLQHVDYVSDGASSHFKNATSTSSLNSLSHKHNIKITWSFTAPGHGKSVA